VILPPESPLFQTLSAAASERRCVIFAGLPGVGKSLLIQQLALIATNLGRTVHLLQWDVARNPFETPELLARYPEIDGITHAAIRKGVGVWVRQAVARWDREQRDPHHLLIGEAPLIGNRLSELAHVEDDAAEPLLAGSRTLFLIPAPSAELRRTIERSRAREMTDPLHERELANANLGVINSLWAELGEVAERLGVVSAGSRSGYDRDQYAGVYQRLLRHRQTLVLDITETLPVSRSPHDLDGIAGEIVPSEVDVAEAIKIVEKMSPADLERQVDRWYET